jgi:Tat protein translocase TatB subunit
MDGFLGMGFWEILLILTLGLILIGPTRIVQFARSLGRMVAYVRRATSDMSSQITKEIDESTKEIKETTSELKKSLTDSAKQIAQSTNEVKQDLVSEGQSAMNMVGQVKQDIAGQGQAVSAAVSQIKQDIVNQAQSVTNSIEQAKQDIVNQAQVTSNITPATPGLTAEEILKREQEAMNLDTSAPEAQPPQTDQVAAETVNKVEPDKAPAAAAATAPEVTPVSTANPPVAAPSDAAITVQPEAQT